MLPDHLFFGRRAPSDVDDQSRHQAVQIESPVEAIGKGGQVVGGVLAVLQRVIGASQRGLEVAQHGIDPQELRQISGLAVTDHDRLVGAACVGYGAEASQAVAEDSATGCQTRLRPLADGLGREATDHAEFEKPRAVLVVKRHRSHERHLVLRATAGLATRTLTTKVGIVDLNGTLEPMAALSGGHGPVDLVVQQPGGGVAHAELALERQRRKASLGLADQIDGQEPGRQRQLGVLHQAAGGQRGLVSAAIALEQAPRAVANHAVSVAAAPRAVEARGPTGGHQRRGAVRLSAKAAKEFGQRHARLELDSVEGHQVRSVVGCTQVTAPVAQWVSLAEAGF